MTSITRRGRPPKFRRKSLAPDRIAVGSYFDSIVLIQNKRIDHELFGELQRSFGPGRGTWRKDIVPDTRPSPTGYLINYLALHRPPRTTVHLLKELLNHGQTIAAVHVALDVLVESQKLAVAWQDFFEEHLVFNPKVPTKTAIFDTTTYYNIHLTAGDRYALYSDEPSRLREGLACCHLEARILGPKALRAAHLSSPEALLQANHRTFWDQRLNLQSPPSFERLARAGNGATNSRQVGAMGDEANQTRARELLRASKNPRGVVVAQDLLANMRATGGKYSTRPIRHFYKNRHDWLLPTRWNVHWDEHAWTQA